MSWNAPSRGDPNSMTNLCWTHNVQYLPGGCLRVMLTESPGTYCAIPDSEWPTDKATDSQFSSGKKPQLYPGRGWGGVTRSNRPCGLITELILPVLNHLQDVLVHRRALQPPHHVHATALSLLAVKGKNQCMLFFFCSPGKIQKPSRTELYHPGDG